MSAGYGMSYHQTNRGQDHLQLRGLRLSYGVQYFAPPTAKATAGIYECLQDIAKPFTDRQIKHETHTARRVVHDSPPAFGCRQQQGQCDALASKTISLTLLDSSLISCSLAIYLGRLRHLLPIYFVAHN